MTEIGEFEMFVPFGTYLPKIGDTFPTVTEDEKHSKGEECEITVTKIESLEWDMKRNGIIVNLQAFYKINKEGLRLVSGG